MGQKPPSNMTPQRGGTPRNAGSPPPDVPPQAYSRPPRTQSYREGATSNSPPVPDKKDGTHYTPQPGVRRGETMKQGNAPDKRPLNMSDKPTGTAVPERRDAKDGSVMPSNWSLSPDPQGPDARGSVGYRPNRGAYGGKR